MNFTRIWKCHTTRRCNALLDIILYDISVVNNNNNNVQNELRRDGGVTPRWVLQWRRRRDVTPPFTTSNLWPPPSPCHGPEGRQTMAGRKGGGGRTDGRAREKVAEDDGRRREGQERAAAEQCKIHRREGRTVNSTKKNIQIKWSNRRNTSCFVTYCYDWW